MFYKSINVSRTCRDEAGFACDILCLLHKLMIAVLTLLYYRSKRRVMNGIGFNYGDDDV